MSQELNQRPRDQIDLWKGSFGDQYIDRNRLSVKNIRDRIAMWRAVLPPLVRTDQILEIGSGVGANLFALKIEGFDSLHACEPNAKARAEMYGHGIIHPERVFDGDATMIESHFGKLSMSLVFTCGVLIHINPKDLREIFRQMCQVSRRYIILAEYFSPTPTWVPYHGEQAALYKDDFGGRIMDQCPGLKLLKCKFFWKRTTGIDNLTVWTFEKSGF